MKKFYLLLFFIIFLAGQSASAENIKIGSVDLIKALNESNEGKKAKNDLEFLIQSKQTVINDKGQRIEQLRADVEKQASVLSAEARKTKEDELERLIREYQRLVSDSQNEVKKKEAEFTAAIVKELRTLIRQMGKEGGYTMIIENAEGIILYTQKGLDLTEEVIKRYNELKAREKESKAEDAEPQDKKKQ